MISGCKDSKDYYFMFISMVRLAFTSTCFLLSFPFHGETSPNRRLPQPGSTGAKKSACAKIAR